MRSNAGGDQSRYSIVKEAMNCVLGTHKIPRSKRFPRFIMEMYLVGKQQCLLGFRVPDRGVILSLNIKSILLSPSLHL